jgi:Tfp pilus assembly protein PilX
MFVAFRKRLLLADERGFSIIVAIVVLAASSLLLFAAIDSVLDNVQTTRADLDQKRALLAADAGLAVYQQALNANPNYWSTCPVSGSVGATGQTGTAVTVPGSTDSGSIETYAYENLPATGQTGCSATSPITSEIEQTSTPAAGTFRVKITGTSQPTTGTAQHAVSRTLVAQFSPASFLQFIYYTQYEILDPTATGDSQTTCANDYWAGTQYSSGQARNAACGGAIYFITGDSINGPMFSRDDLAVSGTPTFGSTASDAIDTPGCYTSTNTTPSAANCGTPGTTTGVVGTLNTGVANEYGLPSSDAQLEVIADGNNTANNNGCYAGDGCVFVGPTTIVLTGSTFTVTNANYNGGVAKTGLSPSNGVIYVANTTGQTCAGYTPYLSSYSVSNCGNATVSGTYSSSFTIGTDNDIIINGNLTPTTVNVSGNPSTPPTPTGTALLGLIAADFVRIYHPLSSARSGSTDGSCGNGNSNGSGSLTNPYIYAAILALNHSFIVDNYDCGSTLGKLNVYGAIAQMYRGPVGTESGSSVVTGYTKNYYYDRRFQTLAPPYFLNPVNAGRDVSQLTECDSASTC